MPRRSVDSPGAARDPAGEDLLIPRLVFRVAEDAPFHPERSLRIPPAAILALFRFEVSQVFKHQDTGLVCLRKLHNASAHQMRHLLISVADLAPEVCIVLLVGGTEASLTTVAGNPSE